MKTAHSPAHAYGHVVVLWTESTVVSPYCVDQDPARKMRTTLSISNKTVNPVRLGHRKTKWLWWDNWEISNSRKPLPCPGRSAEPESPGRGWIHACHCRAGVTKEEVALLESYREWREWEECPGFSFSLPSCLLPGPLLGQTQLEARYHESLCPTPSRGELFPHLLWQNEVGKG